MEKEPQAIEVEVVSIDGVVPIHSAPQEGQENSRQSRQDWRGRVHHLNPRWWPLYFALGIVALAVLLTVGLVVGFVYLSYRLLRFLPTRQRAAAPRAAGFK